MDDASRVSGVERVGDLNGEIYCVRCLQRSLTEHLAERLSFEVLHDDEGLAFMFIDVMNRADVRVVER